MKRLLLGLALVLGVFALAQKAKAQYYGYYDREVIRCSSNGYNYSECPAYYIRRVDRVRLMAVHSKTDCRYGRNWGASHWGVWVDNGCRGTFEVLGWTK